MKSFYPRSIINRVIFNRAISKVRWKTFNIPANSASIGRKNLRDECWQRNNALEFSENGDGEKEGEEGSSSSKLSGYLSASLVSLTRSYRDNAIK